MLQTTSVVIVGGGIIGVSLSYVLSQNKRFKVTLVEGATELASGVTSLGSGSFRQQFTTPNEAILARENLDLWDRLEKDEDVDLGLTHNGYMTIASTPAAAAAIRQNSTMQNSLGIEVRVLDPKEISHLVPGMQTDGIELGAVTMRDGYGSPVRVTKILAELATRNGVDFRLGRPLTDFIVKQGAISAVMLGEQRIDADIVINSAGLDAPSVAKLIGLELPINASRVHQSLTTPQSGIARDSFPCILDPAVNFYLRPDNDSVLVGYANIVDAPHRDYTPSAEVISTARKHLERRWPDLVSNNFVRTWVGCYEGTPDRRALIGRHSDVNNFFYAAGFSGHGFMHSMAVAAKIRDLIGGSSSAEAELSFFSPERFEDTHTPNEVIGRTDTSW